MNVGSTIESLTNLKHKKLFSINNTSGIASLDNEQIDKPPNIDN